MNLPSMNMLTTAFDFALRASLLSAVGVVLVLMIRWSLGRRIAPAARGLLWLPVAMLCLSPRLPSAVGWNVSPEVLPAPVREVLAPVNAPVVVRGEPQLLLANPATASRVSTPGLTLREKLAIAWGAGSVVIFGFWIAAYAGLWRRVHREKGLVSRRLAVEFQDCVRASGLRRAPGLIVTGAVDNPAVAGLWRPAVLMRTRWRMNLSDMCCCMSWVTSAAGTCGCIGFRLWLSRCIGSILSCGWHRGSSVLIGRLHAMPP